MLILPTRVKLSWTTKDGSTETVTLYVCFL
jgi:hypothetical protein